MNNPIYTGSGVALVTPMNADGSINYPLFGELIERQIKGGTRGLIICGTTGEASTMTDEEHIECIRFSVEKSAKRIPVIAGTGSNDTAYMVDLSVKAEKAGANALLLMPPYYNKTSQRGLVRHFGAVADKVKIPIMLYNIPSRTGMKIELSTFKTLAEYPNVKAVKESGGDVAYFSALIRESGLDVYSGDDYMNVPAMALGAIGTVSVMANVVPEAASKISALCLENNFAEAGRLQQKYSRFMYTEGLFMDVSPIPVKHVMRLLGINVGSTRLPLCDMEEDKVALLKAEMEKIGLL
ncbi:MAG: 4-hydroxy-tetrahydrodipicolinate synthase [Oscillospiraceae bacterium]|jgi:4-hydroxy-tetrahydrodipicolinate synthase|nr:4-hydroxy-tetrahydrodipicolinate synthase [Oscillospiraceae bacterium]